MPGTYETLIDVIFISGGNGNARVAAIGVLPIG